MLEREWRKELSDALTGFPRFVLQKERPPEGYTWSGGDLQENKKNFSPRQCSMDRVHKIHFVERKATWRIYMVQVETKEETNNLKTWHCMARYVEACLMHRNGKRIKSVLSRNQSSIMPDNYVVSSSLSQMMNNLNIPWKMFVESRKFRCQQQCFAKYQ